MRRIVALPFALSFVFLSLWAMAEGKEEVGIPYESLQLAPAYAGLVAQYNTKATPHSAFLYCAETGMGAVNIYGLPKHAYAYAVTSSTVSSSALCNVTNGDEYLDEVYPGEGTGWLRANETIGGFKFTGCPCIGMIGYGS